MKIILAVLNSKYVHSSLALRYLKAFCSEYDIEIFESTINENILNNAIKILEKLPDLIGFSCYIWNMEATLKLCSIIREARPDIKIVLGGPEASYDAEEVLRKHEYIDYVIKGEGEVPFKELLQALSSSENMLDNIAGLVYRSNEGIISRVPSRIIEDLNIIPFPYSEDIPDRIIYYEASRGCPFNCSYCLSSTLKGLRYFNLNRVKEELKYFIDRGVKLVKFVDRTFNANKKAAMEIWRFLIENNNNTLFHFEIAGDLLDEEELSLLKSAPVGMFQFEIGVQSTNLKVLQNINRIMDFERVKNNVVCLIKGGNIHCHLDLIAGLPGENLESFKRSFDMCMKISPHVLQLGFLKVLKGSPIECKKAEYGIRHMNFPPYQVLCTKDISLEEMAKLMKLEEVFETYYNSGIFELTMKYILGQVASEFDFFTGLTNFLRDEGFFIKNYDLKDKFWFLLQYLEGKYDKDIIRDILLHDFVIGTKKPHLPDYLKREYKEDVKERVNRSMSQIISMLGEVNPKRLFYAPVGIRIANSGEEFKIQKYDSIVIFDLQNSKFCYIEN